MTPVDLLWSGEPAVRIVVTSAAGSTPREAGTEMFVTASGIAGTIGGGGLEYAAIRRARELLAEGTGDAKVEVTLGPDTGQCCGGRVELSLTVLSYAQRMTAMQRARTARASQPSVYILGSGHVGRALANLFQHLPFRTVLVDQREPELARCTATVTKRLSAIPEAEIAKAPPASAFIILTHDHGLDFLLTEAALARGDAAYVGMIGSATKRAVFERSITSSPRRRGSISNKRQTLAPDGHVDARLRGHDSVLEASRADSLNCAPSTTLTCPIGASRIHDKRPEIIAALVLPEIIAALDAHRTEQAILATGTRP